MILSGTNGLGVMDEIRFYMVLLCKVYMSCTYANVHVHPCITCSMLSLFSPFSPPATCTCMLTILFSCSLYSL